MRLTSDDDATHAARINLGPLHADVVAWRDYMRATGASPEHIRRSFAEVWRAIDARGWRSHDDVGSRAISEHLTELASAGRSAKTRANVRGYLSSWLAWCVETERREDNPARRVRVKTSGGRRGNGKMVERAFAWSEVRRLIEVAQEAERQRPQARRFARSLIYRVAATTGLRRGEIAGLTWGMLELDCERPHAVLPPEIAKNQTEAIIPIPNETAAALKAHRDSQAALTTAGDSPVEPGDGGLGSGASAGPTPPSDQPVFAAMPWHGTLFRDMEAAGIERQDRHGRRASFKSFRAAFNTELARQGVSIDLRMALMRHSDPRLTGNTYLDRENLDAAVAVHKLPELNGLHKGVAGRDAGSAHENVPEGLDTAGGNGQGLAANHPMLNAPIQPESRRPEDTPPGAVGDSHLPGSRGASPGRQGRKDDLYRRSMTPGGFEPPRASRLGDRGNADDDPEGVIPAPVSLAPVSVPHSADSPASMTPISARSAAPGGFFQSAPPHEPPGDSGHGPSRAVSAEPGGPRLLSPAPTMPPDPRSPSPTPPIVPAGPVAGRASFDLSAPGKPGALSRGPSGTPGRLAFDDRAHAAADLLEAAARLIRFPSHPKEPCDDDPNRGRAV